MDEEKRCSSEEVVVRSLRESDLDSIVRIDQAVTGQKRTEYYRHQLQLALRHAQLVLSLGAELEGHLVGFLMATVHYGEFGRAERTAMLDAIGVHLDYRGQHVAQALMAQMEMQLRALGIEELQTQVQWDQEKLMGFFRGHGFRPMPIFTLQKSLAEEDL